MQLIIDMHLIFLLNFEYIYMYSFPDQRPAGYSCQHSDFVDTFVFWLYMSSETFNGQVYVQNHHLHIIWDIIIFTPELMIRSCEVSRMKYMHQIQWRHGICMVDDFCHFVIIVFSPPKERRRNNADYRLFAREITILSSFRPQNNDNDSLFAPK